MSASRPIQPLADAPDTHDALLQREAAGARRRRSLRSLAVLGGLALLAGGGFGARPALHAAKQWQARRLAREVVRLTDEGDFDAARTKVQDALTIWQLEPDVTHAAAFFLTRAGAFHQALPYWQQLEAIRPLTPADLRDYATTQINLGETDAAETLLRRAWPAGEPGTRPDWLLGMQIALRRSHPAEAEELAKRLLDDAGTSPRERLNAATVILALGDGVPDDRTLAWTAAAAVAREGRSPESLAALVFLAQQRATTPAKIQPVDEVAPSLPALAASIEAHPLAKAPHLLFAADLRIALDPASRDATIQGAVDRFGGSKDEADLAALAGWLYGKGEFDKVLAVLPPARAVADRALYMQYLDTLAALGRWPEIRELIQAEKFPLDPMTAQMFLARCAGQLGETAVTAARWQAALDAAGTDPGKLLTVGQYAEKNGATDIAADAFRSAIKATPDGRAGYEALVRLLEATGRTDELRAMVAAMAVHWPLDLAIRNDAAYLDALADRNVPAARDTAGELVRDDPGSLPHRVTFALAELRLHHAFSALDAFRGLQLGRVPALQPRQAAVYAAVLWETSYCAEAREVVKTLPLDRLLPEERELVRPIEDPVVAR